MPTDDKIHCTETQHMAKDLELIWKTTKLDRNDMLWNYGVDDYRCPCFVHGYRCACLIFYFRSRTAPRDAATSTSINQGIGPSPRRSPTNQNVGPAERPSLRSTHQGVGLADAAKSRHTAAHFRRPPLSRSCTSCSARNVHVFALEGES